MANERMNTEDALLVVQTRWPTVQWACSADTDYGLVWNDGPSCAEVRVIVGGGPGARHLFRIGSERPARHPAIECEFVCEYDDGSGDI